MAVTDLIGQQGPDAALSASPPSRWIDRLDSRVVNVLTVIGFGLPAALLLWLVEHYSVNVVVSDQWSDVTVIRASYSNVFSWGALWAQHNENRMFFPNLIVVAQSRLTHFDVRAEEYLSAAMLLVATLLLILAHKRRSPSTPWLYYCPVAILMLSITQYGNLLWGFQMAWLLVLLTMAVALYLVDRPTLSWLVFTGAVVSAVIGSFSSLQGLLIWPAGLVLLYHRRRSLSFVVPWIGIGLASAVLYFHNFDRHLAAGPHNAAHAAIDHPVISMKFFALELGDVLGIQFNFRQASDVWLMTFGFVIVALAVAIVIAYGVRRDDRGGSPLGVSLICMGFLFAATVTGGRVIFGAWAASASRYTTFDLLVPVGIYLVLLGRPRRDTPRATGSSKVAPSSQGSGSRPAWIDRVARAGAGALIAVIIAMQVGFSIPNAIRGARTNYVYQAEAAKVLLNIDHTSNGKVAYYLFVGQHPSFIRHQAQTLQKHHLSVFAGGNAVP